MYYIIIVVFLSGKVVKILVFSTSGDRNSTHLQVPLTVKYCTKYDYNKFVPLCKRNTRTQRPKLRRV